MEKPVLFVNACVRNESRTKRLAEQLLVKLDKPYEEIRLGEIAFPAVNEDTLTSGTSLAWKEILTLRCLTLHGSFRKRKRL